MKKIMFNDKYGLTGAVLTGRKTQTRRIADQRLYYLLNLDVMTYKKTIINSSRYKIGEVVAIAQSYFDCGYSASSRNIQILPDHFAQVSDGSAGWSNKMFVKASLMPHHIKITNVRVERLQDISDADCLAEGIVNNCGSFEYTENNTLAREYVTPIEAYASLIDKVGKKGTWKSNPWVFVYDFELINQAMTEDKWLDYIDELRNSKIRL